MNFAKISKNTFFAERFRRTAFIQFVVMKRLKTMVFSILLLEEETTKDKDKKKTQKSHVGFDHGFYAVTTVFLAVS